MSWTGSTDPCPACDGSGWLVVANGWPPLFTDRPICPICKGWTRVPEVYGEGMTFVSEEEEDAVRAMQRQAAEQARDKWLAEHGARGVERT